MNGFWVWQAVHGGGAGIVSLPYDCNAGFRHRATGWSPGKKSWCDLIALDDVQNRQTTLVACVLYHGFFLLFGMYVIVIFLPNSTNG